MKTFILHLERATDRKVHMNKEANKHNLDYEIFPAFDCLGLTENDFAKFCDMDEVAKYPTWLTPGMVCAAYSHYLIYQKIIDENLDCALITEDDVNFDDGILELLDKIEKNIQDNEVIMLHYMSFSTLSLSLKNSVKLTEQFSLYRGNESFPNVSSAAGYIITKAAAKTLSKLIMPVKLGTDSWRDFGKFQGIGSLRFVYPQPIKSVGFKSKASASNSRLWNEVTGFIDSYKIPPLFQLFRYLRLRSVDNRSQVIFE